MASFLERYDAGQRRRVWDELHELGPLALVSDATRRDIHHVAHRTIERAAQNAALLHRRLVAIGYSFLSPEHAYAPASPEHVEAIKKLRDEVGSIPPTVTALLETIGSVFFRGWLPDRGSRDDWEDQYLDPFELMWDIDDDIQNSEYLQRERNHDETDDLRSGGDEGRFRLSLAGDYLHKNNVSGGPATVLLLPSDEADAEVTEYLGNPPVPHTLWLVDYLRLYCESGGFRRSADTRTYPEELIRQLADGLLEI